MNYSHGGGGGGSEGVLVKLHWAWDVSQMFVLCGYMMSTDQVIPADKLTPRESLKRKWPRCLFSSTEGVTVSTIRNSGRNQDGEMSTRQF